MVKTESPTRPRRRLLAATAGLLASVVLAPASRGSDAPPPAPAATEAYLSQGRVKILVTWRSPYTGVTGTATAVPQGDEFAYFSFASTANPEVFAKVLGGNDPNWFQLFATGLTDFEYTVTFAGCGKTAIYTKPAGNGLPYMNTGTFPIAGCKPQIPEVTVLLPGKVPLTLLKVTAGTFTMGSPETERNRMPDEAAYAVTLTKDYFLGKYEVTQAQWAAVMGTPMSYGCGSFGVGDSYPVYCVSWEDIRGSGGFIEKLNTWLFTTGQTGAGKFRLPTEAEWEYAARAGTTTRFSFGDALAGGDYCDPNLEADPYAWWCHNSVPGGTQPVGTKGENAFGLFDMHGNVWEAVEDWYGTYPAGPAKDPTGAATGTFRVIRGGSWGGNLRYCRSAARYGFAPSYRTYGSGFRLALTL